MGLNAINTKVDVFNNDDVNIQGMQMTTPCSILITPEVSLES